VTAGTNDAIDVWDVNSSTKGNSGGTLGEALTIINQYTINVTYGPSVEDMIKIYKAAVKRSPTFSSVSATSENGINNFFQRNLFSDFPHFTGTS